MRERKLTLFAGIVHHTDSEQDFADVSFITLKREIANQEFEKTKDYAIKILRLKCVVANDHYALFQSINKETRYETFWVERIVIMKGIKDNEGKNNQTSDR